MIWRIRCYYTDGDWGIHPYPYTSKSSAYRAARRLKKTGGIESTKVIQEGFATALGSMTTTGVGFGER